MWQTSDDVPPEIITVVSSHCGRDDCKFSARIGETTLAGVGQHYDAKGNKIIRNGNDMTVSVECGTCWCEFKVKQYNGKVEIIGVKLPKV